MIEAMVRANCGSDHSAHGSDSVTADAVEAVKKIVGFDDSKKSHVSLLGSTTAANKALFDLFTGDHPKSPHASRGKVLVCGRSHTLRFEIQPSAISSGSDGKITPDQLESALRGSTPLAGIWLDNPTNDTVYRPEEVALLARIASSRDVPVGMDMERLGSHLVRDGRLKYADYFNAGVVAASLGFGKSGGPLSSACVITGFKPYSDLSAATKELERIKLFHGSGLHTHGFIGAAGWKEWSELWKESFRTSNSYADSIFSELKTFEFGGKALEFCNDPPTTNMIFASLPKEFVAMMSKEYGLSVDSRGFTRIIAHNLYSEEDVGQFIADLRLTKELYDKSYAPQTAVGAAKVEEKLSVKDGRL